MSSKLNILGKNGEEVLQISPFCQSLKFGEPSCTPSQQINLLGVKEEFIDNSQNPDKAGPHGENFLQIWEKEIHQDDPKEDDIPLEGPVGDVLGDFQNRQHESLDAHSHMYQEEVVNLEGFFGEAPKDFEQIIDECSFDNCHLGSSEDSQSMRYKSPTLNRVRTHQPHPNAVSISKKKLKKREAKRLQKRKNMEASSGNMPKNEETSGRIHNKESLKNNLNKSGLIIKIRSGNDVIMKEEVQLDDEKKTACLTKTNTEESKVEAPNSSCSTSTLSIERQEMKSRKLSESSVSSIELDNNIKIFCRSIGPLKAAERRQKVLHYLEKKRSRKWHKRINYTTRKQVADIRPRYKGRFVTSEQYEEFQVLERKKLEEKLRQKIFKIEKVRK